MTESSGTFYKAIKNKTIGLVRKLTFKNSSLINTKNNIDIKIKDDQTSLHSACQESHFKIVKLLFENGANVNISDSDGWTPLHWACQDGQLEIVKLLISKDNSIVDVNAVSKDGNNWTPLHAACHNGHFEVVKLLVENGADVNFVDKDDSTPLSLSCICKCKSG